MSRWRNKLLAILCPFSIKLHLDFTITASKSIKQNHRTRIIASHQPRSDFTRNDNGDPFRALFRPNTPVSFSPPIIRGGEEYVPFFGPDLMPARRIFGNKRRTRDRRLVHVRTGVRIGKRFGDRRWKPSGAMCRVEESRGEKYHRSFRSDISRGRGCKKADFARFVCLSPPALLNLSLSLLFSPFQQEIHPILTPPLFESSHVVDRGSLRQLVRGN